jgi:hypothetical protein
MEIERGIPQVEPRLEGHEWPSEPDSSGACAVGLTNEGAWRFIHADGTLSDGARVMAKLPSAEAVAFGPNCDRVALATKMQGSINVQILNSEGHLEVAFTLE